MCFVVNLSGVNSLGTDFKFHPVYPEMHRNENHRMWLECSEHITHKTRVCLFNNHSKLVRVLRRIVMKHLSNDVDYTATD